MQMKPVIFLIVQLLTFDFDDCVSSLESKYELGLCLFLFHFFSSSSILGRHIYYFW
jgi:hypothetical protein